jgi:hypothetical protein
VSNNNGVISLRWQFVAFSCYVLLSFIVSDHIVYVILHVSATLSALLKHFIVKTLHSILTIQNGKTLEIHSVKYCQYIDANVELHKNPNKIILEKHIKHKPTVSKNIITCFNKHNTQHANSACNITDKNQNKLGKYKYTFKDLCIVTL